MFLMAGTPSSVVCSFRAPLVRASWKPRVSVRIASVAAPKSTVTPSTVSGVPYLPMLVPGAMPVASAAASNCAGRPVSAAPDGPTQIPMGMGESCRRPSNTAMRSRDTTAPPELICRISACDPWSPAWRMDWVISSMRISSIRPLTCTTSTGASCAAPSADGCADVVTCPLAPAGGARRPTPAATAKKMIASLRKRASGGRVDSLQFFGAARLVIVAGKGGVGKTTVTAVLAQAATDAGLRVLAVELEGKPVLADLLAHTAVEVLTITAPEALADYLDSHGLKRVSKRLATSGIIDVVATAAPGIDDIVVLGKLKQLERTGGYDLIVVDGPAAGHAITFLMSARGLLDTVRGGPIRTQAEDVLEMFHDPTRCQVLLVTLPETTPINEVIETAYAVEERVGVQLGPVVVNGVDIGDPIAIIDADEHLVAAAEYRNHRRASQRDELTRLSDDLALAQIVLPQLPVAGITSAEVAELATALVAQIQRLPA
ncbi:MAG: hypothetical protein F2789_15285 [Actinobacteria bacterium]|nr:hypothetical protein [Actinomycetota bacterium]